MEKQKKLITIIILILLSVPGVYLTIKGIKTQMDNYNFMKTGVEIDALITKISSDTKGNHEVSVNFFVNGKNYKGILNQYTPGMEVDKYVSIYYNDSNPTDFHATTTLKWQGVGIIVVGLIILSIAIKMISSEYKSLFDMI